MNAIVQTIFVVIMAVPVSFAALEDDLEVLFDDPPDGHSGTEITVSVEDVLVAANDIHTHDRILRNLKEFMFHYDCPGDDELAVYILFGDGVLTSHGPSFFPTAEERIELLDYLISEKRIVPDDLISRCYASDFTRSTSFDFERFEMLQSVHQLKYGPKEPFCQMQFDRKAVCKWFISKCSRRVEPLPDVNEGERWYSILHDMRHLCHSDHDRINAYKTLKTIEGSERFTDIEKTEMRSLFKRSFHDDGMLIIIW